MIRTPDFFRYLLLGLFLLAVAHLAPAEPTVDENWTKIHHQDDVRWAKKTGLSPQQVRSLRAAADIDDDTEAARIDSLDTAALAFRKQVLLVTAAGNGHCLTLTVFSRLGQSFQKIWEADEIPGVSGFCHNGAYSRDFNVRATKEGKIIVEVPKDTSGTEAFGGLKQLIYRWNGKTYVLSEQAKY